MLSVVLRSVVISSVGGVGAGILPLVVVGLVLISSAVGEARVVVKKEMMCKMHQHDDNIKYIHGISGLVERYYSDGQRYH